MMVNFPLKTLSLTAIQRLPSGIYNDAVLANLDVVSNRCSLHNGICTNVNVVADFHGIVVEISSIRLVRGPKDQV